MGIGYKPSNSLPNNLGGDSQGGRIKGVIFFNRRSKMLTGLSPWLLHSGVNCFVGL